VGAGQPHRGVRWSGADQAVVVAAAKAAIAQAASTTVMACAQMTTVAGHGNSCARHHAADVSFTVREQTRSIREDPRWRSWSTPAGATRHTAPPVTVKHIPNLGDVVFDSDLNPLIAHLAQPAPPWDPATLLNIGTVAEPHLLSLTTTQATAALQQLGALVALAAADEPPTRTDP
jgi:hypothetical protein